MNESNVLEKEDPPLVVKDYIKPHFVFLCIKYFIQDTLKIYLFPQEVVWELSKLFYEITTNYLLVCGSFCGMILTPDHILYGWGYLNGQIVREPTRLMDFKVK